MVSLGVCVAVSTGILTVHAANAQNTMKFTCGKAAAGEYTLSAATRFDSSGATSAQAFGFDLVGPPTTFAKGSCSSDKPFFFSASVPEGNYRVNLVLGSGERSVVTVRAESRRLFIDRMEIAKGAATPVDFNVNVRTDVIAGATGIAAKVKLKPREIGALDWDNKLTLEFNGEHPGFRSISIRPINDVPTLYLAGDSTVVDQDKEPWAARDRCCPCSSAPDSSLQTRLSPARRSVALSESAGSTRSSPPSSPVTFS